jgi:hypothetical protein
MVRLASGPLRLTSQFEHRVAASVDGLTPRHLVCHATAGELCRRPPYWRLTFAYDGRLFGDQSSVAPEFRGHRRLTSPPHRRTDRELLVQAAALVVEADPTGFDGHLFLPAIRKTVQHGHVSAKHPAAFQCTEIALGPAFSRQGRPGRIALPQPFPEIVLAAGKLALEPLFNVPRVAERRLKRRYRIGHSTGGGRRQCLNDGPKATHENLNALDAARRSDRLAPGFAPMVSLPAGRLLSPAARAKAGCCEKGPRWPPLR